MPLTDTAIRNAKPAPDKAYKLADEKGMYVLVHQNGSKYFRLDYRFDGKRKTLALGTYPEVSLKEAREKRDTVRKQIADGIDPGLDRRLKKLGTGENTFQALALEWFEKKMLNRSDSHQSRTKRMLERDLFPWLGGRPIADIKAPELLQVIRRIESRNAIETAHRALQTCGQVFRYAIATGRLENDITNSLKGALTAVNSTNFASMTDPQHVKPLLQAIENYSGSYIVKCALQLAPMLFVRPGELRNMQWHRNGRYFFESAY